MSHIKRIDRLVLSDIFTTRKDTIGSALKAITRIFSNKAIKVLDLSSNAICPSGCQEIVDLLKSNPEIKHLYLNHVALSEDGGNIIAEALLNSEIKLVTFQAIKNRMGNSIRLMAKAIEKSKDTLRELVVYQNNVKEEYMSDLLNAIAKCSHLEHLDISDNLIKSENIELLSQVVTSLKNLTVLKIDDCNITDKDSFAWIRNVKSMGQPKLKELYYNYNDLEDVFGFVNLLIEVFPNILKIECKTDEDLEFTGSAFQCVDVLLQSFEESEKEEEAKPEGKDEISDLIKNIQGLDIN